MYFVDDICEEKIKELDLTIKLYGLLSFSITFILIITALLLSSIWIFYLINKDNLENEFLNDDTYNNKYIDNYFLEHSFTSDNDKQIEIEKNNVNFSNDIYISKWDIPKFIKEKAFFWKSNLKSDDNFDYKSYNSLIDLYVNDTTNQPDQNIADLDNIKTFDDNNEILSNEFLNDSISDECNSDEFISARTESMTESIQKSLQTNLIENSSSTKSNSVDSLEKPLNFQNISLIDDESDDKEFNEEPNIGDDINHLSIHSMNQSSNDIALKLKSIYDELNIPNSKIYSINMSNFGPQYLSIYLNMIYGNWDEFEQRSMILNDEMLNKAHINNVEQIDGKDIKKMIKIINKNSIDEFKKDKIIDKLEILRIAYITETYHEIILNDIIRNIKFLVKVINNDDISNQIKCEIYQLFHCSFWYLSEIPLTFDFAENLIKGLIDSLCKINFESIEFKDGIRCLYKILSYSNIDDFITGGIFNHCFKDINNYNFEKQNIVWELLKLIICEWMLETNNLNDNFDIYEKLNIKFSNLIRGYVEKDNIKYQEFLYIWKMLKEKIDKSNTDFDINNKVQEKEILDNKIANENSRITSDCKIKRKLSITSKMKGNENIKYSGLINNKNKIDSTNDKKTPNNLKDVTNFIKAYN